MLIFEITKMQETIMIGSIKGFLLAQENMPNDKMQKTRGKNRERNKETSSSTSDQNSGI